MLYWTLQITVLSIILIFLVHHLINFFKSTLTVPKVKDLVNAPTQKYENMYNIISQQKNNHTEIDYTDIDLLPKPNVENMKNELKHFLKEQLKTANGMSNGISNGNGNTNSFDFTTDISVLDSKQNFNTYAEY